MYLLSDERVFFQRSMVGRTTLLTRRSIAPLETSIVTNQEAHCTLFSWWGKPVYVAVNHRNIKAVRQ